MAKRPHFLDHPNWAGIGGIATIIGTAVAIWVALPSPSSKDQAPKGNTKTQPAAESSSDTETTRQPAPDFQPEHIPGSFVFVNGPKPTQLRVEVDPDGLFLFFDFSFQQKLNAAVDELAPKIKKCFGDYQAAFRFDVDFAVKVVATADGIAVPRNEISNPLENELPDHDVEKMKDVITAATFPPPEEAKANSAQDSYQFMLKLTFVPAGD